MQTEGGPDASSRPADPHAVAARALPIPDRGAVSPRPSARTRWVLARSGRWRRRRQPITGGADRRPLLAWGAVRALVVLKGPPGATKKTPDS